VAQRVAAYPISIDPDRFRAFTEAAGLAVDGPAIEVPDAPLLYFGVERLDYTKGIPDRLEAFERALEESREMVEGARFVQWAAPSRSTVPEYQAEREAIERAAEHLNARFDATPLEIEFAAHAPELVAPALEQADVCVVSSVADGMNLVAKEFSAVHSAEHPGVLVLSDMCGAAEELTDALLYPAGDVGALSDVLQRAYFMSDGERRQRAAGLRGAVDAHTSSDWLREFVSDLREVQRRTKASETPKARHRQTVTHGDSPPLAPKPQVAG
jgi:trehalose 6-phosphate synthase